MRAWYGIIAIVWLLVSPARLLAQEEAPVSSSSGRGPRIGMIAGGAAALGAGWLFNAVGSSFAGGQNVCGGGGGSAPGLFFCLNLEYREEWRAARELGWIPVIGPWIQLAVYPNRFEEDAWGSWWVASGLLQAAGLGMLIAGLAQEPEEPEEGEPQLSVVPILTGRGASLLLRGRW